MRTPQIEGDAEWRSERDAFFRMLPELLKSHANEFVAIYGQRVVAQGKTNVEVARDAFRKFGNVPMYIHRVSTEPKRVVRVVSPRVMPTEATAAEH